MAHGVSYFFLHILKALENFGLLFLEFSKANFDMVGDSIWCGVNGVRTLVIDESRQGHIFKEDGLVRGEGGGTSDGATECE